MTLCIKIKNKLAKCNFKKTNISYKKLLNKIRNIKAWQQLLSHLYRYHQTLQCTKCQIAHEVKSINCQ